MSLLSFLCEQNVVDLAVEIAPAQFVHLFLNFEDHRFQTVFDVSGCDLLIVATARLWEMNPARVSVVLPNEGREVAV